MIHKKEISGEVNSTRSEYGSRNTHTLVTIYAHIRTYTRTMCVAHAFERAAYIFEHTHTPTQIHTHTHTNMYMHIYTRTLFLALSIHSHVHCTIHCTSYSVSRTRTLTDFVKVTHSISLSLSRVLMHTNNANNTIGDDVEAGEITSRYWVT